MTFKEWEKTQGYPSGFECIGREIMSQVWEAATMAERIECWEAINSFIKEGTLQGNGCDESAQRNGLVLATNIINKRSTKEGKC